MWPLKGLVRQCCVLVPIAAGTDRSVREERRRKYAESPSAFQKRKAYLGYAHMTSRQLAKRGATLSAVVNKETSKD